MIREIIVEAFDKEVKRIFKNKELQKFILEHERKNLCLDNLHAEIAKIDLSGKVLMNRKAIIDLTNSVCNMFCRAALDTKIKELKNDHGIRPRGNNDLDTESEEL